MSSLGQQAWALASAEQDLRNDWLHHSFGKTDAAQHQS
jgi:hypothetical protein